MNVRIVTAFAAALLSTLCSFAENGIGPTGFLSMTTHAEGEDQPAALYVPKEYDPSKAWPLVVFLHGMGERGSDGWRQTEVGIGKAIRWDPERFPCLVFMPQCARTTTWSVSENKNGASSWKHIDNGIEQVLIQYTIDEDRVSLTGLSMGGYGTFIYGAKNAGRFSAFMPVCGGGRTEDAEALAKVPMRVFHGAVDPVVKPEQSERMVEAVRAAGGDVELTIYPGVGHDSWLKAYDDAEAIAWLLARRRK